MSSLRQDWWEIAAAVPVSEVAAALGLETVRSGLSPCPACGAERRDRRGAVGLRRDDRGWHCFKCQVSGDGIDLAALALFEKRGRELRAEQAVELRAWFAARGWCPPEDVAVEIPKWKPPPPKPPVPPKRVPRVELKALWEACVPVDPAGIVGAFLREREMEPEALLPGMIRQLPEEWTWPRWWPAPWSRSWQLVALLREPDGSPVAFHGRAVDGATPKTRNPLGAEVAGTFLASSEGLALLRGESKADEVLVVEGFTDWLRAALICAGRMPVLGGISGSFRALGEVRWPEGCRVWIATDEDAAGERYAQQAQEALGDRARRLMLPDGQDFDEAIRSWADLQEVREDSTPPAEVVEAALHRVQVAPNKTARLEAMADVLESPRVGQALGAVYRSSRGQIGALSLRLKALEGIDVRARDQLLAVARTEAARLQAAERWGAAEVLPGEGSKDGGTVAELLGPVLDEHTLPEGLLQPPGWEVNSKGIYQLKVSGEGQLERVRKADAPMVVTGRLTDLETGAAHLALEWLEEDPSGRTWRSRVVPRAEVADRRALTRLAGWGAPVHSGNAADLVRYLSAFESTNRRALPTAHTTGRLGWQGRRGELGFLLGRRLFTPDGVLEGDGADWPPGYVHLMAGEGSEPLVAGYQEHGSWAGWLAAMEAVRDRPALWLSLYAALVPPLMALVPELPGFTVDWSGTTSQGKTTALRLAASAWGCPDERSAETVLHTWDASATWIERTASLCDGLPLLLDDTKRATRVEVSRVLYDVAAGQGSGRGTVQGLQRRARWRTVLLSTGEAPATTVGREGETSRRHGGAAARVLELWGSPLGGASADNAALSRDLTLALLDNHGHAGSRLVDWLVRNRPDAALRRRYRALMAPWSDAARGNAVASRAAGYLAALDLGREMAEQVLKMPRCEEDPLGLAWEAVCAATEEADRATAALQLVRSWAAGHQRLFWGRQEVDGLGRVIRPPVAWYGRWNPGETWEEICIRVEVLEQLLRGQGYDSQAVIRTWADRGWLKRDKNHLACKRTLDGDRPRLYVLSRAAFELDGEGR